jgi:glycosyltransferase involved in cell wall biosynthesis
MVLEPRPDRSSTSRHAAPPEPGWTDPGPGNRPLISVILPFFNAARFIREAIESVLVQSYDHWELWLIDDGSTDGSSEAARTYSAKDPEKVHYVEHEGHANRGLPASRNVGLEKASGKYVALLDADDVWLPQKLEEQVLILETHPEAAMVYGRSKYWYSWTGDSADVDRDYLAELGVTTNTVIHPPQMILLSYPLGIAPTPCPSDILLRRTSIEQVRGFEESFRGPFTMYEDQAFLAKIYLEKPVFVSEQCWDSYRVHPDSCVSVVKSTGQYHTVRQFFFEWLEAYLRNKGIRHAEIWRALRRVQRPYRRPLLHRLAERMKSLLNVRSSR